MTFTRYYTITDSNFRENRHFTREQLASKLDLSYWALTKYESGERQPDYKTLIAIADFYEVSLDYLLGRTNEAGGFVLEDTLVGLPDEAKREVVDFIEFVRRKHSNQ